jgi:hypothetical protein
MFDSDEELEESSERRSQPQERSPGLLIMPPAHPFKALSRSPVDKNYFSPQAFWAWHSPSWPLSMNKAMVLLEMIVHCFALSTGKVHHASRDLSMTGNIKRDRTEVMRKIMSMNEDLFRKMYRLHRDDFFTLLEIIRPSLELSASCKRAAINSSGSYIEPTVQLAVTLRFLAGASYLDLAFG